ncbi:hypothetical protein [Parachlamydia sp. AcF125]|uniref:hypothetical protein n=1 Tax=Parachlamydia sp. AcF125 TaxID=2795736 RepID=UPI001BD82D1B|nr:hypothetical protein [Parachlamydia sp. AcF125]MBS4168473.1 hypothetical protein [Parachlamydia sp. AcF125]
MIAYKSLICPIFFFLILIGNFVCGAPGLSAAENSFPEKAATPSAKAQQTSSQEKSPDKPSGKNELLYTSPGVMALKNSVWAGSDHLYNLTDKIGIAVEVIKPANFTGSASEEALKKIVADIFAKGNLSPILNPGASSNPLPFFHVLVMLYPHEGGLAVFCEGRLFENVQLERVFLDKETRLQAITWEKQSLVITPLFDAQVQIAKAVTNIASAFVERYKYFEHMKIQRK